jgi:dephospho-CoA kinase
MAVSAIVHWPARIMQIIGLLGGVASGKSLVARQLAELGACVLDADRAGHEVLRLPEVETAARARWGNRVFTPDGHIDRRRLAGIVFAPAPGGPLEREYLEQLTHPDIGRRLEQQIREVAAAGAPAAVLDAAVMLEAGWEHLCDHLIYVDVPRAMRLERARGRGWSEEDFTARENAQQPLDRKRGCADLVIDNSGTPEQTRVQVEQCWRRIRGASPGAELPPVSQNLQQEC